MMYADRFVLCLKHDGKILRDSGGIVQVPFGAEYGIFLKNLNSVRAVAKVTVDGKEASGAGLIIPANGSVDLERFITNGNLDRGNKFKFIERTAGIEAHKGIGSDDGLIRVEFFAEKVIQKQTVITEHIHHHSYSYWPYLNWPYNSVITYGSNVSLNGSANQSIGAQNVNVQANTCFTMDEAGMTRSAAPSAMPPKRPSISSPQRRSLGGRSRSLGPSASLGNKSHVQAMNMLRSAPVNDIGITVAGSESNQKFSIGEYFPLETTSHVIVLQLRGVVGDKKVTKALTVKSKIKCSSCGTAGKSSQSFCSKCGTSLLLL